MDAEPVWHSTNFQEMEAIIDMAALGLSVTVSSLHERVRVTPHSRLRLVWEDDPV